MMSYEMQEQAGVSTWFNGATDLPSAQPLVATQAVFENEEGQRLRLQVSGPEQQVREFLESMSFAFRAEPLSDTTEVEAELAQLAEDRSAEPTATPESVAVSICFDFEDLEPPYQWEIWFDPRYDVHIAGTAFPHRYITSRANKVTATIRADGGRLKMTVWQGSVIVGNQNPTGSLSAGWWKPIPFTISVDGLDPNNQYDLYVYGATI
ncbi:MAG: hypothetical protein R6X34_29190 [Chloroflexota bacterium]